MNVEIPEAFSFLFDETADDGTEVRYRVAWGGRGGAKSHAFATAAVIKAAQKPMRVVCARELAKSTDDSIKSLIEDKIRACGLEHPKAFTIQERRITHANGGEFIFIGMWRNPAAQKSLEGADLFIGEEASAFSQRSIDMMIPTVRKPGSELWFIWNPEFDYQPVDKMFRGQKPPPGSIIREVGWKDNPWFKKTPLYRTMLADYENDVSRAEHIWGGAYVQEVDGAYYAAALKQVRDEGRITALSRDPIIKVRAFWDLGYRDATSIWIEQWVGQRRNVLDYIEGQGQPMAYYIEQLRSRGWGDSLQELPHDGAQQRVTAVGSAEEILRAAGFEVRTIPNQGKGAALERVEATRRLFPRIWFNDTPHVAQGMKALGAYHEKRDEKRGNIGLGPEHDWASDPADAFGLGSIAYEEPEIARKRPERRTYRGAGGFMG